MQTLINLLEATRFLSDHFPDARDQTGTSLLSLGAKAVTTLVQTEGESDQRILLATLVHPFGPDLLTGQQIRGIFGSKVLEYYERSHKPETLVIERLQRLMTKDVRVPLDAGRKVLMANVVARISYSERIEEQQPWRDDIEPFRHLFPAMEALLSS